jgi:hypothetical protein
VDSASSRISKAAFTNKQEFPCLWCLIILQVQQMRNAALEIREEAESTSRFTQITAAANYTSVPLSSV